MRVPYFFYQKNGNIMSNIRLPLRKKIILITTGGLYKCKLISCQKDIIIAVDVEKQNQVNQQFDFYLDKIFFSRDAIVGYSYIDECKKLASNNELVEIRRAKIKIV